MVLFYIGLIARGILFLHKNIGSEIKHQNWVYDKFLCYSIIFCEAFTTELGIVGAVLPERIPVSFPNKNALKEFTYRQYIMLHRF